MKGATRSSEIAKTPEIDFSEDVQQKAAHRAGTLVHRLFEAPRREIESLVGRLMTLHKKLQADSDRIQLDIEGYAELNRCVMQLTTIVADSVGKLPAPHRLR
jgi:hypothetical protein